MADPQRNTTGPGAVEKVQRWMRVRKSRKAGEKRLRQWEEITSVTMQSSISDWNRNVLTDRGGSAVDRSEHGYDAHSHAEGGYSRGYRDELDQYPNGHVFADAGTGTGQHDDAAYESSRWRAVLRISVPVVASLLATLGVVAGTPMVSGVWNVPLLAIFGVGSLIATVLAVRFPRTRRQGTLAGILAVLIAFSAVIGVIEQNVVAGRAQLRGSANDRAVDALISAESAVEVLVDNQRLLFLPSEQAATLGGVYDAAIEQNIRISTMFNPATADVPYPEILEVYRLVNLAALKQAEALEKFIVNVATPETSIAESAMLLTEESRMLLEADLPVAIDVARAGIVRRVEGGSR